ncbi:MAG: hypothetical protein UR80_C0024G0010 [Parcubacteria group bacterium GW2011_GWB1_35_5]|uniref:Methyltransferase domain-containing protein n=1 Tax=Candidatus Zambryskibacteria bacterium RIFCSPLOWO2_01_FULL_35_19 TaxID=1802757 RepID=A0A1G2TY07_9BACT|nr:MAG: hypothetical protein UR50_C0001G0028 [Parcubacteria group bacterium GW2011_GWC1_34_10]KKP80623.1 MAG: hypothetical protein UR80_C0024G0010 [Parcubacteria group bacterium GW2011_GWB1_35_5]OHA86487.1 MAG: hypothetical protein A2726_00220 [Candidatus Zambryskibacteria bacterium RIFCSPHIGHO2_01_FULL_35_32]OHB02167.1 MAG: hypothetical protein A3A90_02205 [Candidatus Zambryskibacteria bacterium RIFCSPLOWO2_01_FULL_35_19]
MKKLAKKEYWDSIYKDMGNRNKKHSYFLSFRNWLKKHTRDYSNFLMWEVLLPKYLPENSNLKIIEIGCAPGKYLINFNRQFGFESYGVEYSEKGVETTRKNFLKEKLNPENIIKADFFDNEFQANNKEKYDIVFSRGFIEHFDNVKDVVNNHLNLIKSGGYIIISIPNLSGINKTLSKILNIDSFLLHNTSIMNKEKFIDLFSENKVEKLYGDYVGVFSFGLFNTNKKWKYYLYRLLLLIQRPFDFVLRLVFRDNMMKNNNTSPYLLFIGQKK